MFMFTSDQQQVTEVSSMNKKASWHMSSRKLGGKVRQEGPTKDE